MGKVVRRTKRKAAAPVVRSGVFWRIVAEELDKHGLFLGEDCALDLSVEFQKAIAAVAKRGATVDVMQKAEDATRALVRQMAEEAVRQGSPALREWTLDSALKKLCPLFPFCDKRR
jgi:hypothetical protein